MLEGKRSDKMCGRLFIERLRPVVMIAPLTFQIKKLGGFFMTYKQYLQSEEWKFLRQIVIDKQEGQCAKCGRDITEVHHLKYPKTWNEDNPDNLIGLCGKCHMEEHGINIPESERTKQAIWDYVLVEATRSGGKICPINAKQCQYEPAETCFSKRRKENECEYYAGTTTLDGREYVICDNRECEENFGYDWE